MVITKEIYNGWSEQDGAPIKESINKDIYKRDGLRSKIKFTESIANLTKEQLQTDTWVKKIKEGYQILSNPHNLNLNQIALGCDKGKLKYGYSIKANKIVVIEIHES